MNKKLQKQYLIPVSSHQFFLKVALETNIQMAFMTRAGWTSGGGIMNISPEAYIVLTEIRETKIAHKLWKINLRGLNGYKSPFYQW